MFFFCFKLVIKITSFFGNKENMSLGLTTKKRNSTHLKHYKDGNTYFKHFIEKEDIIIIINYKR